MEAAVIPQNPQYIKVSEIEAALDQLWEKYQGTNIVRASLFNLVIYTKKDQREDYLQQLAKTIIKKYPCRMIVITEFENESEEFLHAYVSDMMPEDQGSIFCDVINFEVSGSFRERIPFVVLPHLSPEKPVYLLWGDDPLKKDPITLKLENRATRTIFDSENAENIIDFANMVLTHQEQVFCDIADLNWARCASWRDLFANIFNHTDRIECIKGAKEVHITYNTHETDYFSHTKIQAIYFQAWLAAKLGWSLDTILGANSNAQEELCFRYQNGDHSVNLTLVPGKQKELSPGRILSVDLLSSNNERITFDRDPKNINRIAVHNCSTDACYMPIYHLFSKEMAGRSMMHEIYHQGTDSSFLQVLNMIKHYNRGVIN